MLIVRYFFVSGRDSNPRPLLPFSLFNHQVNPITLKNSHLFHVSVTDTKTFGQFTVTYLISCLLYSLTDCNITLAADVVETCCFTTCYRSTSTVG